MKKIDKILGPCCSWATCCFFRRCWCCAPIARAGTQVSNNYVFSALLSWLCSRRCLSESSCPTRNLLNPSGSSCKSTSFTNMWSLSIFSCSSWFQGSVRTISSSLTPDAAAGTLPTMLVVLWFHFPSWYQAHMVPSSHHSVVSCNGLYNFPCGTLVNFPDNQVHCAIEDTLVEVLSALNCDQGRAHQTLPRWKPRSSLLCHSLTPEICAHLWRTREPSSIAKTVDNIKCGSTEAENVLTIRNNELSPFLQWNVSARVQSGKRLWLLPHRSHTWSSPRREMPQCTEAVPQRYQSSQFSMIQRKPHAQNCAGCFISLPLLIVVRASAPCGLIIRVFVLLDFVQVFAFALWPALGFFEVILVLTSFAFLWAVSSKFVCSTIVTAAHVMCVHDVQNCTLPHL